jgi:zinc protease
MWVTTGGLAESSPAATASTQVRIEDAKRAIQASFALSLESPSAILSYYVQSWTYGLPANYWDTYPMRIAAVTPAQAQAAAKKYRAPGRLHIVAVGDARAVAEILGRKAPLEVFDADGRPLPSGR